MAGSKEIKNRITSVKSTHQITKAMEIVSSTKFKKFSALVNQSKPYSKSMAGILANIASGIKNEKHPLFDGRDEVKKVGIIVMASDRGLCGGFNSMTMKAMEKLMAENTGKDVSVIAIGKKARDYCKKRDHDLKAEYVQLIPENMYEKAKEISENIVEYFYEGIFDEVHLIYNEFISAMATEIVSKKILPVEKVEVEENTTYIFEPDVEQILSSLLPKYLNIQLYQAILENTASEHSARKNAMKNATDNAEDMIKDLTLQYNRERQAAITQELSEIVSGAAAL